MAIDLRHRLARIGAWLEAVEETWLGWSFPPAARALAEAGWSPDRCGDYCPRCGTSAGRGELTAGGCGSCRGRPAAADAVVRLGAHARPLREWIHAIKYRRWAEMAALLGRRLGEALAASGAIDAAAAVVVAVPMPWQRRLFRGVDHAHLIAGGVAARLGAPLLRPLVAANGPPQVGSSLIRRRRRRARLRLKRSWREVRLEGRPVVLIDDVRTTGTSLAVAARLLRRLGPPSIVAGVVTVADDPARRNPSVTPPPDPLAAAGRARPDSPV